MSLESSLSDKNSLSDEPILKGTDHEPMKIVPYVCMPGRTRTAIACENCRGRKTKCTGEHPACKRCKSRGLICVYESRDSKGRYQTAFAVSKSQSTSSLRSTAMAMDSSPSSETRQFAVDKRSRSVEQTIPAQDVVCQQGERERWSTLHSLQNQTSSFTQSLHDRQWSHSPFNNQGTSLALHHDLGQTVQNPTRHTRLPTYPVSSSYSSPNPFTTDFSGEIFGKAMSVVRSQPIYPVSLGCPDIRGHRQGASVSSISTGSPGSSVLATPAAMAYPVAPYAVYKTGPAEKTPGFLTNTYASTPSSDFVPSSSSQMVRYEYSHEYVEDQDSGAPVYIRTGDENVTRSLNSFVSLPRSVGENPRQSSSSSLDGALLDPFGYSTSQAF